MKPDSARFVLITGLSGAGKTQALRLLEDLGYYCVDNLPPPLMRTIAELAIHSNPPKPRIAVCVDVRAGQDLLNLPAYLDEVAELGVRPETLYLESSNDALLKRYSESRRRHPAAPDGSVEEGVLSERQLLSPIRARADLLIDTSSLSLTQLRDRVGAAYQCPTESQSMSIGVTSFGFKYGVPQEADLVFDVRFLPNPHYVSELRALTGEEPRVSAYVLDNPEAGEFLVHVKSLLEFVVPRYAAEPKSYLTIGVGCTGGKHRSVAVAGKLVELLDEMNYSARLRHRDIARDDAGRQ